MSDLSKLAGDVKGAFESLVAEIHGKHPGDAAWLKLVTDAEDEFQKLKAAVEGFSAAYGKDAAALTDDGLATVADVARLTASTLSVANLAGDVSALIALAKQGAQDMADIKQAWADFKAGQKAAQ